MPQLLRVRRKPGAMLALIHEHPITIVKDGKPIQGTVQIIDDRPGEGDDTWLLRDEAELWAYYRLLEDAELEDEDPDDFVPPEVDGEYL